MEDKGWESLPEDVLVFILQYLDLSDRCKTALVCKSWRNCFNSPLLWHSFTFKFKSPLRRLLKSVSTGTPWFKSCVANHGTQLRKVQLICGQESKINRENACELIRDLSKLETRRLQSFELSFSGENPLFYNGQEFVICLQELFGPAPEGTKVISQLKHINLGRFPIAFGDGLFECLVENNPDLETLNIQNQSLVCKVTPQCVSKIVKQCRKLKSLALHYTSITEEILLSFIEKDRTPLERLSIKCRREEKYGKDISAETWSLLKRNIPNLRVTLVFDNSCPMFKVNEILKSEIPLYDLILEVQARVIYQIYFVVDNFHETLEKFVVSTTNSEALETALVHLATRCKKLRELCVWQCYVSRETKDKILELCPNMEKCVLKIKGEPL